MYCNDYVDFSPFGSEFINTEYMLSACFFKTNNIYYKDFSLYTNGLKSLISFISETDNPYCLTLFIDQNIYEDEEIMEIINSSKKINPILFKAKKDSLLDKNDKKFHSKFFGTFARFFPLFNFEDNKTKVVCVIDIDFDEREDLDAVNIQTLVKYVLNNKLDDGIYIKNGVFKDLKTGNMPYILAGAGFTVSGIKYDKGYLFDFFDKVERGEVKEKGKYEKRKEGYDFGTDEIFLNNYLMPIYWNNNELDENKRKIHYINNYNPHFILYNFQREITKYYSTFFSEQIDKYFLSKHNQGFRKFINDISDNRYKMNIKDSQKAYDYKMTHNFIKFSDTVLFHKPKESGYLQISEDAKDILKKITMILYNMRNIVEKDTLLEQILSFDSFLESDVYILKTTLVVREHQSFDICEAERTKC